MLKKIDDLPSNVMGIRAEGKVTREDYEAVLIPLLEKEYRQGRRIRFIYQLGAEFSGLTAGAALDDFRVGLKFLRLFEKCAVVTEVDWIRNATQLMRSFMPCPVQVFNNGQMRDAIQWAAAPYEESRLKFELKDTGVLIVRPEGPLDRVDFERLASVVDPWIETHQKLQGVVICIPKFPGWENLGSFIRHFEFVSSHHRKVRRVALAVNGALPELMSKIADHFIEAEVKQFPFEKAEEAENWASG